jgi:peptidoglycan hydrolase-like protein with peptidoglycan-binding domain
MLIDDRSVQRELATRGYYVGKIDGVFGSQSRLAIGAWAAHNMAPALDWPPTRQRIAFEQWLMASHGFYLAKVDGLAGPATQAALEKWQDYLTFKAKPVSESESLAAVHPAVHTVWPRQADVERFYGKVGENQTLLESPYPLFLDWALSQKIEHFSIHEKVHDAALRVMQRVLSHYGEAKIHELGLDQFGGSLSVRKMRNGKAWSMHSWGIAIDWDADRNPLRATRATALMATAPYSAFLDLWEEEGFVSLGRAHNFDWMHVQAARV